MNFFLILTVDVTYGFTNRTPDMKLRRGAYKWLLEQMDSTWPLRLFLKYLSNCLHLQNSPTSASPPKSVPF